MSKNFGPKPYIYPQPVMMIGTYDKNGKPNLMNAAWGGIAGDDEVLVCLGAHQTTDNIEVNKAFTLSPATAEKVAECDYVGIVSQKNVSDKMDRAGFSTRKSEFVNAPVINELPLTLECELVKVIDKEKYIGKIINVMADDSILDENGKITLEKFHPIVFDMVGLGYYAYGQKVGTPFSDGKKIKK